LVQWRRVKSGDAILVSGGTVHAIGSGIVAVEIQQRSAATFRLFDFGRGRELHPDNAVAAARGEPAGKQGSGRRLTKERMQLVADQHFILEQIELPPGSDWELIAPAETWLLVLKGRGWVGELDACTGEGIFLEAQSARIRARASGMQCLVAYVGARASTTLLRSLEGEDAGIPRSDQNVSFLQPS
jgi:mannose-6-phosphate isomerase